LGERVRREKSFLEKTKTNNEQSVFSWARGRGVKRGANIIYNMGGITKKRDIKRASNKDGGEMY